MSLTSLLSDKNISNKLREQFSTPLFDLTGELKAPVLTTNPSLVGTAFDYLMRFKIERYNERKVVHRTSWVADSAFHVLMQDLSIPRLAGKGQVKFFRNKSTARVDKQELIKNVCFMYGQSKTNYLSYLSDGRLTDELIVNCIFLAKLDSYLRSDTNARIDFFEPPVLNDINDLKALISLVDHKI